MHVTLNATTPVDHDMMYALTFSSYNIGLAAKIGVAAKTVIPRWKNKNS